MSDRYAHLRNKSPETIARMAATKTMPREPCVICGKPQKRIGRPTCGAAECARESARRTKIERYGYLGGPGRERRDGLIGYSAMHWRLRADRPADATCVTCGTAEALTSALIRGRGTEHDPRYGPYSLDPADYRTMCERCHILYDRAAD